MIDRPARSFSVLESERPGDPEIPRDALQTLMGQWAFLERTSKASGRDSNSEALFPKQLPSKMPSYEPERIAGAS